MPKSLARGRRDPALAAGALATASHLSAKVLFRNALAHLVEALTGQRRSGARYKEKPPAHAGGFSVVTLSRTIRGIAHTVLPDATASFTFSTSSAGWIGFSTNANGFDIVL